MNEAKRTLYGLMGGIVLLTLVELVICIVLELCFDIVYVDGIMKTIIGGIAGSLIAIALACDMYRVFDKAFECDVNTAESIVRKGSLLRMTFLFTIIVLLVCFFRHDISMWMLFLSIMNLKFSAFLVPVVDRYVKRIFD